MSQTNAFSMLDEEEDANKIVDDSKTTTLVENKESSKENSSSTDDNNDGDWAVVQPAAKPRRLLAPQWKLSRDDLGQESTRNKDAKEKYEAEQRKKGS